MSGQLSLSEPRPYTVREKTLAGTIAGYVYPGRGGFEKLKQPERDACLLAARTAIELAADANTER